MKQHYNTYLFFLLLIFAYGCKDKNEWKLPSDVRFSMDIQKSTANSDLTFTGGYIMLGNFNIEGSRTQGDNVNFSRPYNSGLMVTFDSSSYIDDLGFDIPQGTYDYLKISFETFEQPNINNIVIEGHYDDGNSNIPIQLEITTKEFFQINATDNIGNNKKVVLNHNSLSQARITLDPTYWFQTVGNNMLDNADKTTLKGKPTILIDTNNNSSIYYKIIDRIDEEIEVVINVNKKK